MLENSTKSHTQQLKEIFSQAGKLYGSELDRQEQPFHIFLNTRTSVVGSRTYLGTHHHHRATISQPNRCVDCRLW